MKKILFLIIPILLVFLNSCQENLIDNEPQNTPSYFTSSNYSIQELIEDNDDLENQIFVNQLYYLSKGLLDTVIRVPSFVNTIINNVDSNFEISFSDAIRLRNYLRCYS